MNCSKINLSAYLDNELEEREKYLVMKHLDECRKCAEELKALYEINNLLGKQEEIEPSTEFSQRFYKKLEGIEYRRRTRFVWMPIPAMAVLILIIIFQVTSITSAVVEKDSEVKNIVLQQVKEALLTPRISNISTIISFCKSCEHKICMCKRIDCRCKGCGHRIRTTE